MRARPKRSTRLRGRKNSRYVPLLLNLFFFFFGRNDCNAVDADCFNPATGCLQRGQKKRSEETPEVESGEGGDKMRIFLFSVTCCTEGCVTHNAVNSGLCTCARECVCLCRKARAVRLRVIPKPLERKKKTSSRYLVSIRT